MTGADFTEEEIEIYTRMHLEAKKTNKAVPKTFKVQPSDKTRCTKFNKKVYDVDRVTGRLYQGTVDDNKSVDCGEKRFTLAKTNLVDQNLAREYLFREFAHQPMVLWELRKFNLNTSYGKEKFSTKLNGLLNARFDVNATKFIATWKLECFCTYAQAYVDLFKDHVAVASGFKFSTEEVLTLEVQKHKDLLSLIVDHCDEMFDKTGDDLVAMKEQLLALEKTNESFYAELASIHERMDDFSEEMCWVKSKIEEHDDRLDGHDKRFAALEKEMKQLKLGQQQQHNNPQSDAPPNDWRTPLSAEEDEKIQEAFCVASKEKIAPAVTGREFFTLFPTSWLNDAVIKAFFRLLQQRDDCQPKGQGGCYFFSHFFITKLLNHGHEKRHGRYQYNNVKNWTKDIDIFNSKQVFVPIHLDLSHWILAVIDFKEKKIQLYDSYHKKLRPRPALLNALSQYLLDEHEDKKGGPLPGKEDWELIDVQVQETPAQTDDNDCGVFICMFAYLLSMGHSLATCNPEDIFRHGRNFIAISILRHKVD